MAKENPDDKLVQEAQKRFRRCQEAESDFRKLFLEDLRFAHGDSDNGYQWPDQIRNARQLEKRPCLTINKTIQHNRQITNETRQNSPSVRVQPVDGGADRKTAEIINGIVRHIEANSSADVAYETASEFAVDAGIGYWRITTDYYSDDSFDQEIYIKRVKNPLMIYMDPDILEADGCDARFGFVFEDITKDEFEARYPGEDVVSWPLEGGDEWLSKDKIRIAEYFHIVETEDTLIVTADGTMIRLGDLAEEQRKQAKALAERSRPIKKKAVKWDLIAGDKVIERKDWAGIYIPIVRVVGEEVDIDGKTERKGHTRSMKDPARMYNYWSSSATEFVALQSKAPYVGPAAAREGYEQYWNNANTANYSYLPFNHLDDEGNPIPAPQRQQPPVMASAYMQGMQVAAEEMKMASGQYDASMGARSNETSGRAIRARQAEGDTATFHFIDNLSRAIRYTGKILVDLIPKIYDTPRVVRILGEDGKEDVAKINPAQPQAVMEKRNELTGEIERIYNPGVGRYDVTVAVGPSYTTRRAEAFDTMTQMVQGNPQLMDKAGDLIMKAADFPMAEELSERLAKFLPPGVNDDKQQSPEMEKVQQELQQCQAQLQALGKEFNDLSQDKDLDRQKVLVDRYKAETERLKIIAPSLGPEFSKVLAEEFGIQVINSPDIYPGTPPGDGMQQEQPASAGFFAPTDSAGQPAPDQLPA